MGLLEGKVAFITGAARGQGRSHAVRLAREGADVIGFDVCRQTPLVPYALSTPADLEETARLVEKAGRRMQTIQGDVTSLEELRAAVDAGVREFGQIDVVCANAGILLAGLGKEDSSAAFRMSLEVILVGTWNTIQATYPAMVEAGRGGSIICTSSSAALLCLTNGRGGEDGYTAAKLGVIGLVKAYAGFLGAHNIRVNAVAPVGVETSMIVENPAFANFVETNPSLANAMQNALPVEMLQPDDVSDTVLFLASDAGRYYSGHTFALDAGAMARR